MPPIGEVGCETKTIAAATSIRSAQLFTDLFAFQHIMSDNSSEIALPKMQPGPRAAFLFHVNLQIHQNFPDCEQDEGLEFTTLFTTNLISKNFLRTDTSLLDGSHVIRLMKSDTLPAKIVTDFYRRNFPLYRDISLTFDQFKMLVESKARTYGIICDQVTPIDFIKRIARKITPFQPIYFTFRHFVDPETVDVAEIFELDHQFRPLVSCPKIWDAQLYHSPTFYHDIEKLFIPERTFVYFPTLFLESKVSYMRNAAVAVLVLTKEGIPVEQGRVILSVSEDAKADDSVEVVFAGEGYESDMNEVEGFSFSLEPAYTDVQDENETPRKCSFLLSESEIRVMFLVRGDLRADTLMTRVIQTARFYHALLLQLPTVKRSDVCVVYDLDRDIERSNYHRINVDYHWLLNNLAEAPNNKTGLIKEIRVDTSLSWFTDLCTDAGVYMCFTNNNPNHRLWIVEPSSVEDE
ncbi:hypothetical protein M3Y98_01204100 [Aphelenchoides besseyi]|nr:hypothetical protein M3Y98_01204100 [Aphelenchoides besseyi]KAI6193083.1 hypothetical protein M3Y96_00980500 [Aphelenchoides besseyi]